MYPSLVKYKHPYPHTNIHYIHRYRSTYTLYYIDKTLIYMHPYIRSTKLKPHTTLLCICSCISTYTLTPTQPFYVSLHQNSKHHTTKTSHNPPVYPWLQKHISTSSSAQKCLEVTSMLVSAAFTHLPRGAHLPERQAFLSNVEHVTPKQPKVQMHREQPVKEPTHLQGQM